MKRNRFLDSVSFNALMRKEIANRDIAKHTTLSGLSREFRDGITWFGPEAPAEVRRWSLRCGESPMTSRIPPRA